MPDATAGLIQGTASFERRGARGSIVVARLAEGATADMVQEQLDALAVSLQEEAPSNWTDVNDDFSVHLLRGVAFGPRLLERFAISGVGTSRQHPPDEDHRGDRVPATSERSDLVQRAQAHDGHDR